MRGPRPGAKPAKRRGGDRLVPLDLFGVGEVALGDSVRDEDPRHPIDVGLGVGDETQSPKRMSTLPNTAPAATTRPSQCDAPSSRQDGSVLRGDDTRLSAASARISQCVPTNRRIGSRTCSGWRSSSAPEQLVVNAIPLESTFAVSGAPFELK
jgi:hypothetical protein